MEGEEKSSEGKEVVSGRRNRMRMRRKEGREWKEKEDEYEELM